MAHPLKTLFVMGKMERASCFVDCCVSMRSLTGETLFFSQLTAFAKVSSVNELLHIKCIWQTIISV